MHPGPTGGALARRRKSGAGSGPAAGLARRLAGGPWQPWAGPSLNAKSPACEEASWLFPFHHSHRAGLPRAPPSIIPTAQGSQALGLRVLALGQTHPPCARHHTLSRHGRAGPGHPDQTSAAFPSSGSPAPIPGPSPGRGRGEAGHDDIRHASAPRSRPDPRSFPAREQSVRQTAPGPVPRWRAMFTPSARRKIIFPPFTTHMIEESRLIPP